MKRLLLVLLLFLLSAQSAQASVVFSDNFDSYSNGNLVGQGSWTGGGNAGPPGYNSYQVQGTTVHGGTKAVSIPNNVNGNGFVYHTFTGISTGLPIVTFYAQNSVSNNYGVYFGMTDTSVGASSVGAGWYVRFSNTSVDLFNTDFTASAQLLASYSASTWYQFDVQVDVGNKQARARVDGGAWTSYVSETAFNATLGTVVFNQGTNFGPTNSYVDDLSVDDGVVASASTKPTIGLVHAPGIF